MRIGGWLVIAFLGVADGAVGNAELTRAVTESKPAAPVPPPFSDELRKVFDDLNAGRYLHAMDRLERGEANPAFGGNNPLAELAKQLLPFVNGTVRQSDLGPGSVKPLDPPQAARFEQAKMSDALAEIIARARNTQIVILNEAHHSPRDRAFALSVARALKPLGYSVLAAEAFANKADAAESQREMTAMAAARYPRVGSGLYTKDPVFGDFVRQALAMGYRPVAYEQIGGSMAAGSVEERVAAREQAQTENLVSRIFAKDKTAKVLIYVGYSHAAEEPIGEPGQQSRWMAARLKAATGIDPLTIDQTAISETALDAEGRQIYDLLKPSLPGRPVVLSHGGKPLSYGTLGQVTDIQVVHPPLRFTEGRPAWLLSMGRHAVPVPKSLYPATGRRLVQAFLEGEAEDAVPVDQVIVEAGRTPPALMLPKNPVRLAVQNPAPAD